MCLYPKEREIKCRDGVTRVLVTRCGRCFECQKAYSNEWALRLYHEKKYHLYSLFLTLTYDEAHCPSMLVKSDLQAFISRLKKEVDCRYFACGEYGGRGGRPHYHLIIFTNDIDSFGSFNPTASRYSSSVLISRLWPFGFHTIETKIEFATLRYVAKYMQKARLSDFSADFQKPFLLMSHKPYIGMREEELCKWYFGRDKDDKFYVDGVAYPIPNFYTQVLERNGFVFDKIYNSQRLSRSIEAIEDNMRHIENVYDNLSRPIVRV